ncbi:hypothetical protein CHUAL_013598 [Chamberlinius hualienensis]
MATADSAMGEGTVVATEDTEEVSIMEEDTEVDMGDLAEDMDDMVEADIMRFSEQSEGVEVEVSWGLAHLSSPVFVYVAFITTARNAGAEIIYDFSTYANA